MAAFDSKEIKTVLDENETLHYDWPMSAHVSQAFSTSSVLIG